MARVDTILERLSALYPRAIDLSLDRIEALMDRLGAPHRHLPPVVHVAGTNGKGSTIATMRACLEAAGYTAHIYTSPHLVSFTERIRLAGHLIGDDAVIALIEEVERKNAGAPITVFEVITAAAFLAFAAKKADILLLETGLGGRLDATNLVDRPEVTVITPVSMDHMAYLGDRLPLIAAEKAGILKPGRPAVLGPQHPDAAKVIAARAEELKAPLHRFGPEWYAEAAEDCWCFQGEKWDLELPFPSLPGRHQIDNAGLALASLEQLQNFDIKPSAIRQGLRQIDWPARLQRLRHGPLFQILPKDWELWLDGGHNAAAAEALSVMASGWTDRPLHLVLGMLNNRDVAEFVRPLSPYLASVRTVTIPGEANSHEANDIAARLSEAGIPAAGAISVRGAIEQLTRLDQGMPSRVLIAGSLYLAGHVLSENG